MGTLELKDLYEEQEKIKAGKKQLEMNLAGHEGALQVIDNLIKLATSNKKSPEPEIGEAKGDSSAESQPS